MKLISIELPTSLEKRKLFEKQRSFKWYGFSLILQNFWSFVFRLREYFVRAIGIFAIVLGFNLIELEKENSVPGYYTEKNSSFSSSLQEDSTDDFEISLQSNHKSRKTKKRRLLRSQESSKRVRSSRDPKSLKESGAPNNLEIYETLKIAIGQFSQDVFRDTPAFKTARERRRTTGQYHLKRGKRHRYVDVVLESPDHPAVGLELAATLDRSLLDEHFARALQYGEMLSSSSSEVWVVHFTCQDGATENPYWPNDEDLHKDVF
ncbi:18944_t:CDS:2 [Gigaspora rosea]|nr:18944_t:CDS:2 [Gigaspora rosea]